ncbi:hypothetical protein DESUT3_01480 [Desulfuromonas versatilis]|uniref:Uncharacterized protein n=1 Tax=Desulfuromonas versatilis TaxID=2802975 RepID=A0ABM8HLS7_9BACT|nr:hypothetical protein DESUT3_01480 [Desulfuromonas versatilis]
MRRSTDQHGGIFQFRTEAIKVGQPEKEESLVRLSNSGEGLIRFLCEGETPERICFIYDPMDEIEISLQVHFGREDLKGNKLFDYF